MKKYLIYLTNSHESEFILVDEDIWSWAMCKTTDIPQKLLDSVKLDFEFGTEEAVNHLSDCKDKNDRALMIECNGATDHFSDIKSYSDFIVKNNIEIIDYFNGYIY